MAILLAVGCGAAAPAPESPAITVTVDDARTFQTMDGFGASLTDSSAWLIAKTLSPPQRHDLLESLFSATAGAGLSYLRQPMGASDFATSEYTYDDVPDGQTDFNLKRFSIARDEEYIIPLLKQILAINPSLKIMASPWSAPAWMKESGRLNGGRLKNEDAIYHSYAEYFVRFIRAYAADGISIDAVTLQNEPWNETDHYPSMRMQPEDEARIVRVLGPMLEAAGIKTKIVIWDHNWDHPEYPLSVLKDAAARPYIDGVAFHGYAGRVSAQSVVHDAFPDKNIYFTECSGGDWSTDFASNLIWDMQHLLVGAPRNWARTVIKWNLALDDQHGPRLPGAASNCRGVVTIQRKTGAIMRNEEYYALGQVSKFVQPGARRIFSDNPSSVAFVNPVRSLALILFNAGHEAQSYSIQWRGKAFSYTLPARSVVTFIWPPKTGALVHSWMTTGDQSRLLAMQPDVRFQ